MNNFNMPSKAALWIRVSEEDQTTDQQLSELTRFAKHRGLEIVKTFDFTGLSAYPGIKGTNQRFRFLKDAMEQARKGEFDVLLVWALDRLSRGGPEELLAINRKFLEAGCQVWSIQESFTELRDESIVEFFLAVTGWMSKIESKRKGERVKLKMAELKAQGKHVGRPKGSKDKKKRKQKRVLAESWTL